MRWLIIGLVLLASSPVSAQDNRTELEPDPFNDILRDQATISGGRVVGFQAVQPSPNRDVPAVASWLPATWAGQDFCLRAMSADGLYEAVTTYHAPASWSGGLVYLGYPTPYGADLAGLAENDIAVSVQVGACDEPGEPGMALAFWNAAPGGPMRLLVNSFRADEAIVYLPSGEPVPCDPITEGARVAFDMSCEVPAAAFEKGATLLSILTIKDGEIGEEVQLKLLFDPNAAN